MITSNLKKAKTILAGGGTGFNPNEDYSERWDTSAILTLKQMETKFRSAVKKDGLQFFILKGPVYKLSQKYISKLLKKGYTNISPIGYYTWGWSACLILGMIKEGGIEYYPFILDETQYVDDKDTVGLRTYNSIEGISSSLLPKIKRYCRERVERTKGRRVIDADVVFDSPEAVDEMLTLNGLDILKLTPKVKALTPKSSGAPSSNYYDSEEATDKAFENDAKINKLMDGYYREGISTTKFSAIKKYVAEGMGLNAVLCVDTFYDGGSQFLFRGMDEFNGQFKYAVLDVENCGLFDQGEPSIGKREVTKWLSVFDSIDEVKKKYNNVTRKNQAGKTFTQTTEGFYGFITK